MELKGAPGCSTKTVEGIAYVIPVNDPEHGPFPEFSPERYKEFAGKGMILVTNARLAPTEDKWILASKGVIQEVGSKTTHAVIVCTGAGIGAIAGVSYATSKIKTGQKIRMNGPQGLVEILDEKISALPGIAAPAATEQMPAGLSVTQQMRWRIQQQMKANGIIPPNEVQDQMKKSGF
jgi:phosphohistidine swiveling domain-containing protein